MKNRRVLIVSLLLVTGKAACAQAPVCEQLTGKVLGKMLGISITKSGQVKANSCSYETNLSRVVIQGSSVVPSVNVVIHASGKTSEELLRDAALHNRQCAKLAGLADAVWCVDPHSSSFVSFQGDEVLVAVNYYFFTQSQLSDEKLRSTAVQIATLMDSAPTTQSTSGSTNSRDDSGCTRVTAAVKEYFSDAQQIPNGTGSCAYALTRPTYERFPVIHMNVNLYGDRGEPIQEYARPKVANKEGYRSYSGLGQLAEWLYLPNWQAIFLVYRNNKRVLDIKFTNCDCEFLNPVIDGSRLVSRALLGAYKTQAALTCTLWLVHLEL